MGVEKENQAVAHPARTARHEWLEMHVFRSIDEARSLATEWLGSYNNECPHSSIDGILPVKMQAKQQNSTL